MLHMSFFNQKIWLGIYRRMGALASKRHGTMIKHFSVVATILIFRFVVMAVVHSLMDLCIDL